MRFKIVFATVFAVCCCFSVLNVFSVDAAGEEKLYQYYVAKEGLLNIVLTDEEVLRCKNFGDNIKELKQILTEEELQEIVSQCSLLSQEKSELFGRKEENGFIQSPQFENQRMQEQYFISEEQMTLGNSKQQNVKNSGSLGKSNYVIGEQNEGRSNIQPIDESENQNKELDIVLLNATDTNWSLWNYLFGGRGSLDDSSSVRVKQNESNSNEKEIYKPENQETELNATHLNSTNTTWNLWNYLFGGKGSSNSSNETRPSENHEIDSVTESYIYFENSTDSEYLRTEHFAAWNLIMPGTKWCGSGNTAEYDNDLGYFEDVDRCCRAHDKCNDVMLPGQSKYNLTNTSPFTELHCKCDDELYDCLDKIDSVASNTVGSAFFNIFGRMCYTLDYPKVCKKSTLFGCQEYVIDETAEKVFQWKPAKKYLKKPFTIPGK